MQTVNIYAAKTNLSKLIEDISKTGKSILISRAGKPVARLESLENGFKIKFSVLNGKIKIAENFNSFDEDENAHSS